jgi:hypothetical protein
VSGLLLAALAASVAIEVSGLRWHLPHLGWVPEASVWCGIIGIPISLLGVWLGWLPIHAQRTGPERARAQLLDAQGDRLAHLVPTPAELIPLTLVTAHGPWTGRPAALLELFDAMDRQLVVLGAPGSGKTTLALLLGDLLYRRAEADAGSPVPVLFELSRWPHWLRSSRPGSRPRSWPGSRPGSPGGAAAAPSLADWMAAELVLSHGLSPATARADLRAHRILPILDGLDEIVDPAARESCLEAVARFLGAAAVDPFILSCRDGEFRDLDQTRAVRPDSCVTIEPLSTAQIVSYLRLQRRPGLDPLIQRIEADPAGPLARVLGTSLWLRTVASDADFDTARLSAVTSEPEVQDLLWEGYLARQLGPQPTGPRQWLTWIARALEGRGEQVFWTHELYRYVPPAQAAGEVWRITAPAAVLAAAIAGVAYAVSGYGIGDVLAGAVVAAVLVGAGGAAAGQWVLRRAAPVITRQPLSPRSVFLVIRRDLVSAAGTWLRRGTVIVVAGSVPLGIFFAIVLGLSGGWTEALAGLLIGPLICALLTVLAAVVGVLKGFGRALLVQHTGEVASTAPAVDRIRHGVLRQSATTGLVWGIQLGVIFGGIAAGLAWLTGGGAGVALGWLALVGLPVFVVTAMSRGLGAPLGYWLRRRALARQGLLPRGRLQPFLDRCTQDEHRLLRRSGASYRFIHRELQEYLAAQSRS